MHSKNKILDIILEGKGIIPYEKIVDMNSMFLTPENVFFKTKQQNFTVTSNKKQ